LSESALQAYVDADVSISAVERACEEKVSGLERQIEQARTAAQQEVERIRAQQAAAVWKINDSGRTAEQIAELLEIPHKDVRRLLSAGRAAAAHQPTPEAAEDRSCDGTNPPDQAQPQPPAHDSQAAPLEMPSEQRILSGVDAQ
jgi:DNA-directed RNA polymerase specialized sigma24 family protein